MVGRPVAFRFDGAPLVAMEGETIAAALAAADITTLRRTASGAPRGVHCGMGACFDCVVAVDGRIGQRACMTKVTHGMDVRGASASSPAPLAARPSGDAPERECDVLVVGAGPAGLSAAITAAEAGASVTMLDERAAPGGQYAKALAPSHAHLRPDRQFRLGRDLAERARAAGVRHEPDSLVWAAFAPDEVAALVRGQGVVFRPRALILATGAHEVPVAVPGWTLPGIMTTGGLQGLARSHRVVPGQRVVVAGNGPLNLQLACELVDGGARVVAVVEAAARPGPGMWRDLGRMAAASPDLFAEGAFYLARLAVARVPVLWGSRVRAFEGAERVEAAIVATPQGTRRLLVDVVGVNLGFQSETGLARALGARHVVDGERLRTETDADGATSLAGVFAVGDGAALGGARVAMARGRLAGLAAARDLGISVQPDKVAAKNSAVATAFQAALWRVFAMPPPEPVADDTIVCRCEEVTAGRLRAELARAGSLPALKRATRAGMGACQGRFCAATILRLCGPPPASERAFAAPRPPLRPVPAASFMIEAKEFSAPLVERPATLAWTAPTEAIAAAERRCDVAVIGGGAVGLATARCLARDGADVLVLDRAAPAMGVSTVNAGSLHAQLLAYDIDPDDPSRETPAVHALPLGPRAIALWREIAAEAGEGLGLVLGGLMLATTPTAMDRLRAKAVVEARYNVETHVVGPDEAARLMPEAAAVLGAVVCPGEGRIDPLRATWALLRLAQDAGARVLGGVEVTGLAADGAGWRIATARGAVMAGRVVICAGAHSACVASLAGVDLPVRGTVQQVIVTDPAPPDLVRHLVAVADRHLSLKQQENGRLLIGGGWFGRFDTRDGATSSLRRNIEGNLWVAGSVLPALHGLHILRAWTGLAPSVDGAPILGEVPGRPGLFVAAGANGLTLGPIFGQLTAEAIRGVAPDPRLRLERFA